MNIDEIKKLFGQTIFWNYLEDWPGDEHKEPEEVLDIFEGPPDTDGERRVSLSWVGGELTVTVAHMYPATATQDPEGHTTDADVEFVARLPVIIPALLSEIDRLKGASQSTVEDGVDLIRAERERQVAAEGWTPEHDDTHDRGELALEAAMWLLEGTHEQYDGDGMCGTRQHRQSKPRVRQLVIAGALIAAEVDRLQRVIGNVPLREG